MEGWCSLHELRIGATRLYHVVAEAQGVILAVALDVTDVRCAIATMQPSAIWCRGDEKKRHSSSGVVPLIGLAVHAHVDTYVRGPGVCVGCRLRGC